jgi:hypothetical protein
MVADGFLECRAYPQGDFQHPPVGRTPGPVLGDALLHLLIQRLGCRHEQDVLTVLDSPLDGVVTFAAARPAQQED